MKKLFYLTIAALVLTGCAKDGADVANDPGSTGQGGSLARFSLSGDRLYAVNDNKLKVFDISDPASLRFQSEVTLDVNGVVETLFGREDNILFAGTTSGMYIFDISDPDHLKPLSKAEHIVSCDPVVADQDYAYVTLRSTPGNTFCNRSVNELHIYDIRDLSQPAMISQYPMTFPIGLAIYGDTLLVCDNGIRILDVSNPQDISVIGTHSSTGATDIIPYGNLMLIGTETGLEQYRYHKGTLTFLSRI